jgi:hypothetical protein
VESTPKTPEHIDRSKPHRIDRDDVNQAKKYLDGFRRWQTEEDGRDLDWKLIQEHLVAYNSAVADLLKEASQKAESDTERQRLAETVWTLYWAANTSHDPQQRLEFDTTDVEKVRKNEAFVYSEQLKV